MAEQKTYYPFLDTFRGVAILWVILHHINQFFNLENFLGVYFVWFDPIANIGYLGVDIFFVISGFLITGILIEGFDRDINIKRFYARRCFKILPQYMSALGLGIFISYGLPHFYAGPYGSQEKRAVIASYFFFLQNFFLHIPVLAHTWSLAIEEHFYLFYPLLALFIFKFRRSPGSRKQWLVGILLIMIFSVNGVRMLLANMKIADFMLEQATFYRIDALIFGCLLKIWEPDIIRHRNDGKIPLGAFCFFCWGVMTYVYFIINGADGYIWYTYTLAYLAPGAILVAALKGLDRFLENPLFQWVGKNSYGIYVWHYILAYPFVSLSMGYPLGLRVGLYLALSIWIGWLSTITVERYFLNLRKKWVP